MQALDPNQPMADVRTMELVEAEVSQRRLLVILLGSFAGVAVLSAMIGIYGVIAFGGETDPGSRDSARAARSKATSCAWSLDKALYWHWPESSSASVGPWP
jgi:hypothetical protein